MEIQTHGNTAQMSSIIYHSELLLMVIFSVFMVDLVLRLKLLTKLEQLIGKCKFLMKVLSQI